MTGADLKGSALVVGVLLVVGSVRVAVAEHRAGEGLPPAVDSADSILAASATALDEAHRRARPLGPDEKIDPNQAVAMELDRLPGVGPAMADAIVAARSDLGPFREPGDLVRVRGIGPATVERLRPFLEVGGGRSVPRSRVGQGAVPRPDPELRTRRARVDLNTAGSQELQAIPGIGPALAERMLNSRRLEGPFRSVDDLERVPGIGALTARRIWSHAGGESSS